MSAAIKIEGLQVRTVLRDKTEAGIGDDLVAVFEIQRLREWVILLGCRVLLPIFHPKKGKEESLP